MRRLSMGLEGADHPKFLTLTSPAQDTPAASLRLLSRRFEKLRRLVRKTGYRGEFEFGGVVELTQRGIAHFHVLFRGPYLPQVTWSRLAVEAGFGEIVDIRAASRHRLAGYMTKTLPGYLTKGLANPTAFPRHFRRVRFSRKWAPDWVVRRRRDPAAGPSPWGRVPWDDWLMRRYALLQSGSRPLGAGEWALEGAEAGP